MTTSSRLRLFGLLGRSIHQWNLNGAQHNTWRINYVWELLFPMETK